MRRRLRSLIARIAGCHGGARRGLLFTFEHPPVQSVQTGYRGTGHGADLPPGDRRGPGQGRQRRARPPQDPADPDGAPASEVYQNVQVLGDLNANQFIRVMAAITEWVSPEQGCAYCHAEGENLAADTLYTKKVARRMLQMTRHINADWKPHVAATGVTCYTCHRGKPVPANIWFNESGPAARRGGMAATRRARTSPAVGGLGLAALRSARRRSFGSGKDAGIRVVVRRRRCRPATEARSSRPSGPTALMMHMSEAPGRQLHLLPQQPRLLATGTRARRNACTAWHGIQMVRDLNASYLDPLQGVFPANRLGPLGDAPKVATAPPATRACTSRSTASAC